MSQAFGTLWGSFTPKGMRMPHLAEYGSRTPAPRQPLLVAEIAATPADVLASQQLRFSVFAQEMGARLASADQGIDRDRYDDFCQHLLVRDASTDEVVASTRILNSDDAPAAGGFYSQDEFALGRMNELPGRVMEVGRTCVHADYRTGRAINALWTGLAGFMTAHRFDFMMGCASIPLPQNDPSVHALLHQLYEKHLGPPEYRVVPRHPVPQLQWRAGTPADPPPLLKAYLRLGAWVCGEACHDPDFGVADVFILLDVRRVPDRYRRHFLRGPVPFS
nr:GNAT family N-acyltransferase [Thioalkalivibrio nitratireducens]